MRRLVGLSTLALACLLALPAMLPGQEPDRGDRELVRERLVKSGRYVTALPDAGPTESSRASSGDRAAERPSPKRRGPSGDVRRSRPSGGRAGNLPAETGAAGLFLLGVFKVLGILALLVILGLILVFLLRRAGDRRLRAAARAEGSVNSSKLANVMIDVDLLEVERLAEAGRFSEAIHLLLLRTIGELVRLARIDIRPAWTSREIAALIPLAPEPLSDLHELVHSAELGHFASVDSSPDDYSRARSTFDRLVLRLKGATR